MILIILFLPIFVSAKTISEFENEVNLYTKQLDEKKKAVALNSEQIEAIKVKISNIESSIAQATTDIENLKGEIEESSKEIENKKKETKGIISYYQLSKEANVYLEYFFGSKDITDMIYRLAVSEQLTDYNEEVVKDLNDLIIRNHQQQEELKQKQEELTKLKADLEIEKFKIEETNKGIIDSMPSVEAQINEAKKNLSYFKKLGCGRFEDILACQYRVSQSSSGSLPSVGMFKRPMSRGYITQGYHGGHKAFDLSSHNGREPIYPIAAGRVHTIYTDDCIGSRFCPYSCNGNAKIVVIKHNYNGRYLYSAYVHLSSYGNISVGQYVTSDTVIGYMGNTGCSTGAHLHLEIAPCYWKNNGGCTWSQYSRSRVSPGSYVNFPHSWTNR